jgi:putative transcriptional regulator
MESSIAPAFLVSSPHMKDAFFEKTLIFLAEHDAVEGSFGIVVNRSAEIEFRDVLSQMEIPAPDAQTPPGAVPVLSGGPVTPELGWVIHTLDWTGEGTRAFGDQIGITASRQILEDIAAGRGPRSFLFCLGYAGWGPDQLLDEIRSGAWLNVPLETDLLFHTDIDDRWDAAIARLGFDPSCLSPTVGGA